MTEGEKHLKRLEGLPETERARALESMRLAREGVQATSDPLVSKQDQIALDQRRIYAINNLKTRLNIAVDSDEYKLLQELSIEEMDALKERLKSDDRYSALYEHRTTLPLDDLKILIQDVKNNLSSGRNTE